MRDEQLPETNGAHQPDGMDPKFDELLVPVEPYLENR